MLTISTIPESLVTLEKHTGRTWTDSELFDLATHRGIKLHAAAPLTAITTIHEFVSGVGLVEKFKSSPGHSPLAVLYPFMVSQLWIAGETETKHPSRGDDVVGEYCFFTEPVRVTREQVRIKAATLTKMVDMWKKAQDGLWVGDPAQPSSMKCQHFPAWMFQTEIQHQAPTPKPIQRSLVQEQAILYEINLLGIDPRLIKKYIPGKSGVKKQVRDALKDSQLFAGSTIFDKAWARLSASGDVIIK